MTYYTLGRNDALTKLGMLSGSFDKIPYKPGTHSTKRDPWTEFDRKPGKTHEEKFGEDMNRDKIQSSAIEEAFEANEDMDQSFGPEPAFKMGMNMSGIAPSVKPPSLPKTNAHAAKPPQLPKLPKPPEAKPVGNTQQQLHGSMTGVNTAMTSGHVGRRMTGSAL